MKNLIVGLVLLILSVVFGGGCASRQVSQMDTRERVEIPVLLDGKVYTNSFERTDRSKIAPGGPRTYNRGGGGSFFRFSAGVGGGGGYGYPVVTVPIESQEYFQSQTAARYGLGGGGSGHYVPTPSGSYSPTPMVGGRYGY
jgi:hypothetical protein